MIFHLLAKFLARPAVTDWLIRRAMRTPFTHIVGKDGSVYMERYWLFNPFPESSSQRKRWQFPISIRLHHIMRPDEDRNPHDHPWHFRTIILRGWYDEVRPLVYSDPWSRKARYVGLLGMLFWETRHTEGHTSTRKFGEYHRISEVSEGGVWTMFITGKYRGTWGFLVDGVKVPWRKYLGIEVQS